MGVKDGGYDVELSDSEDDDIQALKNIHCGKDKSRIRHTKGGFGSVDITVVSDHKASISKEDGVALKNGLTTGYKKVTANEQQLQQKTNDDTKVAELEAKLDSEMRKIEGLTYWQVFQATNILATKFELLSVFLPMSQERKKEYVLHLLEHGSHGL
ncbi:hypothetical protein M0R45_008323 [Rubus argutus]|uniref:Uncharacterized protein n=1 Tax=Rubus argutus TaxID=59490 RepID=A0AAW1Y2R1_RUBAR